MYPYVKMQKAQQESDQTLIRAVGGDPEARRLVLAEYGPMVWGLCYRLASQPEDAYQEIWEKVLKALGRFRLDGPASLRTWIATIAHRHLVDRHRRKRVRGEVVELGEIVAQDVAPDERIARRQRASRLEQALKGLPQAQRRVVVLHHLNGMPLDELASREGVAVGTIKSRLHRGRARLADLLGGER